MVSNSTRLMKQELGKYMKTIKGFTVAKSNDADPFVLVRTETNLFNCQAFKEDKTAWFIIKMKRASIVDKELSKNENISSAVSHGSNSKRRI